jgi:hypothetical protein
LDVARRLLNVYDRGKCYLIFVEIYIMSEFVNVFPEIVIIKRPELIGQHDWEEMHNWAADMKVKFSFKNHWHNIDGNHYSFEVKDEQQRLWFALKWS